MPEVSVIIVNWNGRELLRPCLVSLAEQSYADFEVIVVDNGSTDGSVTMLHEEFPDVNVIELATNTGFCHANNVGIKVARGAYVALLNNDTKVDPGWLFALTSALADKPCYSFASSRMISMKNPGKIDRVADSFTSAGFMFGLGSGEDEKGSYEAPFEIFGVCGGAAFFRREVFHTVGLFDERFFAYLEDLDLNWRMAHAGLKGIYIPAAVVFHLGGGTSQGMHNPRVIRRTIRNLWFTMVKNIPIAVGFRMAPRVIAYHIYWALKFRCVGQYVLAWLSYVVQEPRMYRDRFRILGDSVLAAKDIREMLVREDRRVFAYLDRRARASRGRGLGWFWRWMFHAGIQDKKKRGRTSEGHKTTF